MATLNERLTADMKAALRARESLRLSTIRLLLAALKNAQIEAMHPLSDEEALAVLRKQARMRHEAIEQYRKGGREDLASKEEAELAINESYLPAAATEDQIRAAVREAIAATGASGPKDMSVVMRTTMSRLGGRAVGRQVQGLVREELATLGG
ncbi:MAG TPA: GatB/YqeY domain-containing protein [Chloroflexota bacterium]|nr:GatB/YqeY domain-containing protein [Chloroflexota bacterium]